MHLIISKYTTYNAINILCKDLFSVLKEKRNEKINKKVLTFADLQILTKYSLVKLDFMIYNNFICIIMPSAMTVMEYKHSRIILGIIQGFYYYKMEFFHIFIPLAIFISFQLLLTLDYTTSLRLNNYYIIMLFA